jgi:hypothetical protein
MNIKNAGFLKGQLDLKNKNKTMKMTDEEYRINREILEKVRNENNN